MGAKILQDNMSEAVKVHLTEEKETLLLTVYAKALDSRSRNSILNDKKADELVSMIDYDFEKLIPKNSFASGHVIPARAKQLDEWVKEFLRDFPNAIVLNLGCGLDTRISRINPSSSVNWFDVDYPEVIKLRKTFFSDRDGYQMIESALTESEWLEKLPEARPTMVVAEGVLEYLTEDEVKTLLNRLTDHFAHGQIAFDVMNSFGIRSGRSSLKETTGAEHKWAVDNIGRVDMLDSKMKRITNQPVLDSKYMRKLPLKYRLIYAIVCTLSPSFRNMIRLLRYEF